MTFNQWRRLVDAEVSKQCGLTADCLPDIDFWAYYYDGIDDDEAREVAVECARDMMVEDGFPVEYMVD